MGQRTVLDAGQNSERDVLRPNTGVGHDFFKMPRLQSDFFSRPYLTGTQSIFNKAHSVNSFKANSVEKEFKNILKRKLGGPIQNLIRGFLAKLNGLVRGGS